MENKLHIYNTLSRKKEKFEPTNPPFVGMYVCGPTVYGDAHLGHARAAITFDIVFRYLKYMGLKVRYVRNITDVGHLESDADFGDDKIAKKAKLEQLEPMEIVQQYTNSYHRNMEQLNTLRPSIEPQASAHIIEQIQMIEKILEKGMAYQTNGSIYFDVEKYAEKNNYGKLSGRILEDLKSNTRELSGQTSKKNPFDFALWKKAEPEHIMRWPSPWSNGFPGWHLECSVMGTKYLGEQFDIHGGGLDLQFPHHECEIAQTKVANGKDAVKYWMHNNMITMDGKKMGKSLGNFITLDQMFSGNHPRLEKAYSPMVVRFFILQAHYRSTLDFSNQALQASEKGLARLLASVETLNNIKPSKDSSSVFVKDLGNKFLAAIADDFNTPILIALLFDAVKVINSIKAGTETIDINDYTYFLALFNDMIFKVLGMTPKTETKSSTILPKVIDLMLNLRTEAKRNQDFATSDKIRKELTALGFEIKDGRNGVEWKFNL